MLCEHAIIRNQKRLPFRWQMKKESFSICHRENGSFFHDNRFYSAALSAWAASPSAAVLSVPAASVSSAAVSISAVSSEVLSVSVSSAFGCGTFFYSAFFYSAFFSCSCFDYAFDSGFCFCRRLCLGSIVAVKLQKQSQVRLLQVRNNCRCEWSFFVSFPSPDVLCDAHFSCL